jgi:SEC-C motif-containing protein
MSAACPCGAGLGYEQHCGRLHAGRPAVTAEDLMRSRYSAHVRGDAAYLSATWHPDTRPPVVELDRGVTWIGLDVQRTDRGNALDADGVVEFTAVYRRAGDELEMHEISRFSRVAGRWVYLDGIRPV